jgi:isoquinoline 1-oxidoreductase subunit beta
MTVTSKLSRRHFLQTGAAASGLILGFSMPRLARAGAAGIANTPFAAWLHIAPDDTITVMVSHSEMGQGIFTSLPMQIAEELEADWRQIRAQIAPADPVYANLIFHIQGTGGSTSTRESFDHLREVGAQAREMLRQAAATRWGVAPGDCVARAGRIIHSASGRSFSYGALAQDAAQLPVPQNIVLKTPAEWTILGKPTPRLDTPSKVDGSAKFGIDTRLPGMLVGTVRACPVFGGKLREVDVAPALAVPGVHSVVKLDHAVIVLADGYWPAHKAALALQPVWDEGNFATVSSAVILAEQTDAMHAPGQEALAVGDAAALAQAPKTVSADYQLPYLAHATMEPMNGTVRVNADGGVEAWLPTQSPYSAQVALMRVFGLPAEKVYIHSTFLGGGFGRRGEVDFAVYAGQAAKASGQPVKIIWPREEDMQHDFYRPAVLGQMRAGLDASGMPTAFSARLVAQSVQRNEHPAALKGGKIDPNAVEGMADMPYQFANAHVDYVEWEKGAPIGFWRSVGHSYNTFFLESFIDEIAHAGGQDPVVLRRSLLAQSPRHLAVLNQAVAAAGWGQALAPGHFQGVAMVDAYGTVIAEVAEISIEANNAVRIHKVTAAVDCGHALNPSTVEAQLQSAIVYGLTAAFFSEITLDGGRVTQTNFYSYPMLKLAQMPQVEVHIINSGVKPGGMGEPGLPPIAPALTNAIFAATGKRLRELPLRKSGFTAV